MSWTTTDPGAGDTAAIAALATARRTKADDLRDVERALRGIASDGQSADWKGRAKEPFMSNIGDFSADTMMLRTALDEQAAALEQYAKDLEAVQQEQQRLETARAAAAQALASAQSASESAQEDVRSASQDEDATAQDRAERQSSANQAGDQLARAVATTRSLDMEWDALVEQRRSADRKCSGSLAERQANGLPRKLTASDIASATPLTLLALFQGMSADEAAAFLRAHPDVVESIQQADPGAVRAWWQSVGNGDDATLSPEQQALIAAVPSVIGGLNGLPPAARVAANKNLAGNRLSTVQSRLQALRLAQAWSEQLTGRTDKKTQDEIDRLAVEEEYLLRVTADPPKTQLYLYDPDDHRIIEMIGTPSPDTKHVITYVPGTFSNLDSFYSGGVQQVGKWLHQQSPDDTVVFVAKDGVFPGEETPGPAGVAEANDPEFALAPAERLRQLSAGLDVDPNLANAQRTAIGHSWGLANITTSETLGTQYGQVTSLSGAGMPPTWQPNQLTTYTDHSYVDILQVAQGTRQVWDGNNPRWNPAFGHDAYYGPAPEDVNPYDFGNLMDQHNKVARIEGNRAVLDQLAEEIFE
ncbi:hypothetical protein [Curtobacterium oceanosedimentum]|uniref:hypothetical protein n=1 Tax=Curtobacterium oceanosedimentum TaxID=465820 RepID=UPI001CE069FE|nr:hypothetical protein [Curtobacterium oceanosedimentum]MCA5922553.1 hypothetical protein [Curtobacterium oceanosedimentum]